METERVLAKLQRLRFRSDYPLRLFLLAVGRGSGLAGWNGEPLESWNERAGPRRQSPELRWRLGGGRCPHCGHAPRPLLRRRLRLN